MQNAIYLLIIQKSSYTQNPGDSGTVDFTKPFDLIVFIIVPILVIILYFIWKGYKKRDKEQKNLP
ncbi:MAG: adenylosuccinate synthetase [Xanthomarina sp.]